MCVSPKVLGLEGIVNEIYYVLNKTWCHINVYTDCQMIVKGLQGDDTFNNASLTKTPSELLSIVSLLIGKKIRV